MDSIRGQTTLDFAIGIGVFLAVILFTFTFVPGILSPFDVTGEDEPAMSNQIADSLSRETLGSASEPNVLDRYCTVEFFNESRNSPPDDCEYDSMSLDEVFDLSTTNVNITLSTDLDGDEVQTPLCWAEEDPDDIPVQDDTWGLVDDDSIHCDTELTRGDNPEATSDSTITARRVVLLHDKSVTMEVVVW